MIAALLYFVASIIAAGIINYCDKQRFFDNTLVGIGCEFVFGLLWPILIFFVIIRFFVKKVSKFCAFIDGIHNGLTKENE